eukprot:maker-scaffold_7-snap-gene-4.0-mRNA-1 protein AED:0.01 eAED:0.01 QI:385/1/1/1/1/1/2/679/372
MSERNEDCVGPESANAGKADGCAGCPSQKACASGEIKKQIAAQSVRDEKLSKVFSKIGRTILVLSGKGGVGKSTVSTNLAFSLAKMGKNVGLLDIDICGPSIPLMLGLVDNEVHQSASGWSPVYVPLEDENQDEIGEIGVMSIGFLIDKKDKAIIWRGPKKAGIIEQFLTSVDWGELDYLIIDTPPGTSDEHISIVQMVQKQLTEHDGAVVVSTPQEVAQADVRKELDFCRTTKLKVLGVVENMSVADVPLSSPLVNFVSPEGKEVQNLKKLLEEKCPELLDYKLRLDVFPQANGGAKNMAQLFDVPFLGRIPIDDSLQKASEAGKQFKAGASVQSYWENIIAKIIATENRALLATQDEGKESNSNEGVVVG